MLRDKCPEYTETGISAKCWKNGNLDKKRKMQQLKTEILLTFEKCYKGGNLAKRRKILEGRNSC